MKKIRFIAALICLLAFGATWAQTPVTITMTSPTVKSGKGAKADFPVTATPADLVTVSASDQVTNFNDVTGLSSADEKKEWSGHDVFAVQPFKDSSKAYWPGSISDDCEVFYTITVPAGTKLTINSISYTTYAKSADFYSDIKISGGELATAYTTDQLTTVSNKYGSGTYNPEDLVLTANDSEQEYKVALRIACKSTSSTGKYFYVDPLTVTGVFEQMKDIAEQTTEISNVTVDGVAISAADLATLKSTKALVLSDAYTEAPAVVFTQTTTTEYTDGTSSAADKTFNAEVVAEATTFVATVEIDGEEYTVTVNKDLTPVLTATPDVATLTSLRLTYGVATINVKGVNLVGDAVTITLPSVDGLASSVTTLPIEDGAVNGSFTLTYKSTEDVEATTVNVTLTAGETTLTIPVTYSSTAAVTELVPVTGSTTWDWATASSMSIQLVNGQGRNEPVILSNFEGWPSTFPADAIEANGEWMNRGGYFQGHSLTFISTVPGYVTVTFSNTGGSNGTRNIMLNGTEFGDTGNNSSSKVTATSKAIAAGKFVISSIQTKEGGSTAVGADAYLRIYKVVFTPCQVATISAGGLTTFCPIASNVAIPEGVTAYAVVADGDVAHLIEVDGTVLGQGEGFVLEGTAGETYAFVATTDAAASVAKNQMVGVIAEGNVPAGCYVLGVKDGECVFGKWAGGATFPAGKAYLNYSSPSGAPLKIVKGDATGIESVIADQLDADLYNVNGQKVDGSYKGLVIKKGQKMLSK